jgi:hypothetical protein
LSSMLPLKVKIDQVSLRVTMYRLDDCHVKTLEEAIVC